MALRFHKATAESALPLMSQRSSAVNMSWVMRSQCPSNTLGVSEARRRGGCPETNFAAMVAAGEPFAVVTFGQHGDGAFVAAQFTSVCGVEQIFEPVARLQELAALLPAE